MIEHPYGGKDFTTAFQSQWVVEKKLKRKAPIYLALRTLPFLRELIWKERPSLVFTYEFGPLPLFVSWLCSFLGLAHVAWTDDALWNAANSGLFRRVRRFLVLRWSSGLVVCNPQTRDFFSRRFAGPTGLCGILQQEGVFHAGLKAAEEEATVLARLHNLVGKKVFLCVGRLSPEKNLKWSVQMFANFPFRDSVLVFCGSGPQENALRALAAKLNVADRVIFTGYLSRSRLLPWYRLGSLLLFPSLNERFGAVVNEALLSGMPVLCSRFAGAAYLIQSGRNGDIIDPADESGSRQIFLNWAKRAEPLRGVIQTRPSLMFWEFRQSVENFRALVTAVLESRPPFKAPF